MRTKHDHRYLRATATALLFSGLGLLVFSGQAAATGTVQVTPNSGLSDGSSVAVSGSGFTASSAGGVIECNNTAGQPTIQVLGNAVPVSCTNPLLALTTTDGSGALTATFTVHTGTVGPPATGADSGGGDAATDAASYPCPPTAAQQGAGASCVLAFGDQAGDQATTPITFSGGGTTTTTTPATTTTQPTTTSTVPVCAGQRNQVTTNAGVMLSVNPATCLVAGISARIEGSGLGVSQKGGVTECSTAAGQGSASFGSLVLPISCATPLNLPSNGDGSLGPAYLTIGAETIGSAPGASAYPCPPTAAQIATGATCVIAYVSATAVVVQVPISFAAPGQQTLYSGGDGSGNPNVATSSATLTSSGASTSPGTASTSPSLAAAPATTAHTNGSLAYTGPGPGIWTLALAGLMLIDLGYLCVTTIDKPSQLLRRLRQKPY